MMAYRVLVSAPYFIPVVEEYADFFAESGIKVIIADVNERLGEEELLRYVADIDGVICGDDCFTERVMDAAPKLKVICKWGTGIDSIDAEAAKARNIKVCRTLNAFIDPVADSVLGYILCFARNIPWMTDQMRRGSWEKIPGRALNECTIGVVGVGNIGRAILRRARPFGARLLGNDIKTIDPDEVVQLGVEMIPLEGLLAEADFICLACDLNPTSHHLIGAPQLTRMKTSSVLINAARGPIIDEAALVAALQNGDIAGVGLDVFEEEPLTADSPLRQIDQCLLAPHNSNSSASAWRRVHENTVRMLAEALSST